MTNQKKFRELLNSEDGMIIRKGLETSSVSSIDAEARAKAWDATFANLDEIVEDRNYAGQVGSPGYSSLGLHGIEFFDATVAAVIRSYAGIFCIENTMSQPNASLPYYNSYGVKTGEVITPNLGVSRTLEESDGYIRLTSTVAALDAGNPIAGSVGGAVFNLEGIPMVPGSLTITLVNATDASVMEVINDNGTGSLIAGPGVLSAGSVTYQGTNVNDLGAGVAFTLTSPWAAALTTDVNVIVEYVQDQPKQLNEVLKGEVEYYSATTEPIIVPYQVNQVTNIAAKKALGINMRQLTLDAVTDEYTKLINKKVVKQLALSAPVNNEVTLDLSNYTVATSDYRTYLESFVSQLRMVDTALARKTEKAPKVTAFLVSLDLGDIFNQLDMITSKWVPNKEISYVDDIVGYYDGIPVVRSKWVTNPGTGEFQGYAIHKTKEGHLAPLMRGMFLPLTTMDEVGSFDNPLLKTGGIFSYEGVSKLTNDLTVGFTVKPGVGTTITYA